MSFIECIMKDFNCTREEAEQYYKGWLTRKTAKDYMIEQEENGDVD